MDLLPEPSLTCKVSRSFLSRMGRSARSLIAAECTPNNSFKPNLLRSTKAMAEKACHGFGSTTQVGLTQALGLMRTTLALSVIFLAAPAWGCEVPSSELSVGGVVSGTTEASVLRLLGEPTQRVETGEGVELQYPGLVVTVGWLEQRAAGI